MNEVPVAATVLDLLAMRGRRQPLAPAIVYADGRAVSYALLHRTIERAGASLAALGIGRSSRVATALPNGSDAAVAELAVMSWATCVPIDPSIETSACTALLLALKVDALVARAGDDSPAIAAARALGLAVVRLQPGPTAGSGCPGWCGEEARAPVQAMAPAAGDVALVLRSSGSTGQPKVVPLTHAQLIARASRNPIDAGDRGLCAVPMFTASAIESNLTATVVAGASVAFLPTFDPAQIVAGFARLQPTYLWAGPAVLAALLDALPSTAGTVPGSLRLLRTGGAPLAPALQEALEARLGIPVMQGYGMTETGGIARIPLPPAPRPAGSVGKPLWPDVAILDHANGIGRSCEVGEVVVRGPGVMTAYENAPEANREAFRDGWFRTGDLGRFDASGYLYLTGRLREMINRGGFKVAPAQVDAAMLRHPAVAEAAAFPVAHPSLGEDVAVAVVLRPRAAATASELRTHASRHLAPFEVPNAVVIVDALLRNAAGKVDRAALAQALRDDVRPAFREASGDDEIRIAGLFAAVLKHPAVGADDNFFALGGDSLTGMQVVVRVTAAYGIDVPVQRLFEAPTPALFAEVVRQARRAGGTRHAIERRSAGIRRGEPR